jgi:hypothetical protein
MKTNTVSRVMHDVGLALWTGGAAMGAVGVNGAASEATPTDRLRLAGAGWSRWSPVRAAAIAAYGIGSIGLTWGNRGRIATQRGVGSLSAAKTVVSAAALAADLYAGALGRRAAAAGDVPVDAATVPNEQTPDDIAETLERLRVVQWVVPALTTTLVAMSARMGEQQRPQSFVRGVLGRIAG